MKGWQSIYGTKTCGTLKTLQGLPMSRDGFQLADLWQWQIKLCSGDESLQDRGSRGDGCDKGLLWPLWAIGKEQGSSEAQPEVW